MSKPQVNAPSLRALSFMLRHKETWPTNFQWDYKNCHKCAMGLAHFAWPNSVPVPSLGDMSDAFHLGPGIAQALFTGYADDHYGHITPEVVANRIDRYLAN